MPKLGCLAIASLVIAGTAGAQDSLPARTLTQMIVGAGMPFGAMTQWTPVYAVGFEITPPRSRTAIRLLGEYGENSDFDGAYYRYQRSVGVQAVGIRSFGVRRLQPYVLAGIGLYSVESRGSFRTFLPTDTGFDPTGPVQYYRNNETLPSLLWGTGVNVRVRRMTLFTELKLPFYVGRRFEYGPQSPLIVGFKF